MYYGAYPPYPQTGEPQGATPPGPVPWPPQGYVQPVPQEGVSGTSQEASQGPAPCGAPPAAPGWVPQGQIFQGQAPQAGAPQGPAPYGAPPAGPMERPRPCLGGFPPVGISPLLIPWLYPPVTLERGVRLPPSTGWACCCWPRWPCLLFGSSPCRCCWRWWG